MAPIHEDVSELIGNTPLVRIQKIIQSKAEVLAKLEYLNPFGSVKDRIGIAMIAEAERAGKITNGATIIEPTSGNTGIALAGICAIKGYRCIIVMPESASVERRKILQALGAEVILTPADKGMQGAIEKASTLLKEIPNSFMPDQFSNPANPSAHKQTTAEEIWQDTDDKVDIVIAGVGTGGTITGIAQALKPRKKDLQIIAVEPAESPVLTQYRAGKPLQPAAHSIEGIGAEFIPKVLDLNLIDEIIPVSTEDAILWARKAIHHEGMLIGISSGAALKAASILANREENAGKVIVVILPDTAQRYLSTKLFNAAYEI